LKKIKLTKKGALALADELNAAVEKVRGLADLPSRRERTKSPALHHFTTENWQHEVLDAKVPVLVDFTATWCTPCKAFTPIIERVAKAHPEVKVGKLDLDESEAIANKYHIQSVPTLLVFIGGKSVGGQSIGTCPQAEVNKFLEQAIKKGKKG
jgi:thioredoxin 1